MALPTALLIKGLAGVGAIGGVVGGGFLIKELFKPKDPNVIIEKLGISGCKLEEGESKTNECELDEAKVKAINFTNKPTDPSTFQISGLDSSKKLKLVIEKGYQDSDFPSGLRFTITNPDTTTEVVIGTDPNKITLKPGVSYDFKVTSDGTKLEKAWTLTTLSAKVGLNCTSDTATTCTIKVEGINVWKDQSNYVLGATVNSGSSSSVTVAKDTKDYNGGFKFTVENDTNLTQNTQDKKVGSVDKLTKEGKSYEINIKDLVGNKDKKWFLVEKTA